MCANLTASSTTMYCFVGGSRLWNLQRYSSGRVVVNLQFMLQTQSISWHTHWNVAVIIYADGDTAWKYYAYTKALWLHLLCLTLPTLVALRNSQYIHACSMYELINYYLSIGSNRELNQLLWEQVLTIEIEIDILLNPYYELHTFSVMQRAQNYFNTKIPVARPT